MITYRSMDDQFVGEGMSALCLAANSDFSCIISYSITLSVENVK